MGLELPFPSLDYACSELLYKETGIASLPALNDTDSLFGEKITECCTLLDGNHEQRAYALAMFYNIILVEEKKIGDVSMHQIHSAVAKCLLDEDVFISGQAARVLAVVALLHGGLAEEEGTLLMQWIHASLSSYAEQEQPALLGALVLGHVLRVPQLRSLFAERSDSLSLLVTGLAPSRNVQLQYHALFALWLLTFDPLIVAQLQE